MSAHRRLLAEHLGFPAPADRPADAWGDQPAGPEPEADLARRIAPNLLLPDEESAAVRERTEQLVSSLKPWDTFEMWLTERVALQEIRLLRCRAQELLLRDRLARRAILCWDEDRRAAVAALGGKLRRRPDEVAPELGRSRHGCEWLLALWESLHDPLDAAGTWDDAGRSLALDLLGVPHAARAGRTPLDPPPGVESSAHLRAFVAGEVGRLRALKATALDDLDARDREAAALGVGLDADPDLARLRRAERSIELSLQMYLSRFKKARPGTYRPPDPIRRPETAWTPAPPATAAPAGDIAAARSLLDLLPAPEPAPAAVEIAPSGPIGVPLAACPPVLAGPIEDTVEQAAGGIRCANLPGAGPGPGPDLGAGPHRPAPREAPRPDHAVAAPPGEPPGNRHQRRAAASRAGRGP